MNSPSPRVNSNEYASARVAQRIQFFVLRAPRLSELPCISCYSVRFSYPLPSVAVGLTEAFTPAFNNP